MSDNSSESLGLVTTFRIKDLKPGDTVLQFFQLKSKDARKTRGGQDYCDLILGDSSGTLTGKMWSDSIKKWGLDFIVGECVKVEGRVENYRDRNQIVVDKIRKASWEEVPDASLLIKTTAHSTESLYAELMGFVDSLRPRDLSSLVKTILETYSQEFKELPAAKMVHHAYKGGLLEHVVYVTRKVDQVLKLEPNVNRNIAIAGAILHDIGKIRELSATGQARTIEGRLLGHVILGVILVREVAVSMGLSDKASWLGEIEHIIVSHHGETEFGAPVKPLTREALIVHFMDNLDSKLKIIEEALESTDSEGFAPYNKWLEGRPYTGGLPEEEEDVIGNSVQT